MLLTISVTGGLSSEQEQAEYRSLSGTLAQGAASGAAGAVAAGALIHQGQKVVAKLGSLGNQKGEQEK